MTQLFADLPEAIDNTWRIAQRCAVMPRLHDPILPAYDDGSGENEGQMLARMAAEGLQERLNALEPSPDTALQQTYRDRLDFELNVIEQCLNLYKTGAVQRKRGPWWRLGRELVRLRGSARVARAGPCALSTLPYETDEVDCHGGRFNEFPLFM